MRSLGRRKARREQGAFLVEGVRLLRDALAAGADLRVAALSAEMLVSEAADISREILAAAPSCRMLSVPTALMRSLSDTDTPQGVLGVVGMPMEGLPLLDPRSALVVVLDGIRDPGNVGTLLRTAAAAGCTGVCVVGGADPYAPKVVRAAMGAHFRLPILADVAWEWLGPTLVALPNMVGADGASPLAYDRVDWTGGAAIVIGNEDHGLSDAARTWCRDTVAIPMARGVESLNAAVSGAVILFEAVRQRRAASS